MIDAATLKKQAHDLVETLPDDETWDDLLYRVYVRRQIERGLVDSEAARIITPEDARRILGID